MCLALVVKHQQTAKCYETTVFDSTPTFTVMNSSIIALVYALKSFHQLFIRRGKICGTETDLFSPMLNFVKNEQFYVISFTSYQANDNSLLQPRHAPNLSVFLFRTFVNCGSNEILLSCLP